MLLGHVVQYHHRHQTGGSRADLCGADHGYAARPHFLQGGAARCPAAHGGWGAGGTGRRLHGDCRRRDDRHHAGAWCTHHGSAHLLPQRHNRGRHVRDRRHRAGVVLGTDARRGLAAALAAARAGARRMRPRATLSERLAGMLSVIVMLTIWELASRFGWQDPQMLPAPSEALLAAARLLGPWDLAQHVGISLFRILAGFGLATVVGVLLGIVLGWSPLAARCLRPFVEVLRPIPPLAWLPLAIIWFGLGEPSKVFVIFLGAFFPIFTSAWRGMTMVSPTLIRAAQTMDVDGVRLLWRVAIPATLPDIAAGLRIGFGLAFGILVAAELIAAKSGMGYLIMEARQLGQLGIAIFGIFLIGVVNLVADHQLARAVRASIGRWSNV